jgi:hypothetical protein
MVWDGLGWLRMASVAALPRCEILSVTLFSFLPSSLHAALAMFCQRGLLTIHAVRSHGSADDPSGTWPLKWARIWREAGVTPTLNVRRHNKRCV